MYAETPFLVNQFIVLITCQKLFIANWWNVTIIDLRSVSCQAIYVDQIGNKLAIASGF